MYCLAKKRVYATTSTDRNIANTTTTDTYINTSSSTNHNPPRAPDTKACEVGQWRVPRKARARNRSPSTLYADSKP